MKKLHFTLISFVLLILSNTVIGQTTGILLDYRDNQQYNTVKIGNQWWMSQNLNYGVSVANVGLQSNNGIVEKTCFANNPSNCSVYGGIYNWNEIMNYTTDKQGICPCGWVIPSEADWNTLNSFLGLSTAGKQMKVSSSNNTAWDGNNSSGFNALPGGEEKGGTLTFNDMGTRETYWSSTPFSSTDAYNYGLTSGINTLDSAHNAKIGGYQVRCIKDIQTTFDTVHTKVTDTLSINAVLTGIAPPNNTNLIKIFPNPAKDHITIDFGSYAKMNGYTAKIINALGQTVFTSPINQQQTSINLSSWSGKGVYYLQIIDAQSNIIDKKEIVLQ